MPRSYQVTPKVPRAATGDITFPGQPGRRHSTLESARRQPENQPRWSDVTAATEATLTVTALSSSAGSYYDRRVRSAPISLLVAIGQL
jgi:hypothetical protein